MGKKKRRAAATPAIKQLEDTKVTFTTHEYEHSNDDADGYGLEAARKLGYDERQVFKTLMADTGDERVIGVVPVNGHMSLKELAHAVGAKKAEMASRRWPCVKAAMWWEASPRSDRKRNIGRCLTNPRSNSMRYSSPEANAD